MSQPNLSSAELQPEENAETIEYRPVSMLAVLTIALGVASSLALAGPVLFVIPAITLLVGLLAWRSIANSEGSLAGRNIIVWGLVLATFFTAMSLARSVTRERLAVRDAREITDTFIHLLLTNQPEKAHQLQYLESLRQPTGTALWLHYQTTTNDYDALRRFVDAPLIHALLTLGDRAKVDFYTMEEKIEASGRMYITLLYTVSYLQAGKVHTFYARFTTRRDIDPESGILSWSVENYESGVRPFVQAK